MAGKQHRKFDEDAQRRLDEDRRHHRKAKEAKRGSGALRRLSEEQPRSTGPQHSSGA
jgi:hypothetical protein